jgi:antitoxin component of RelBE/YafQ-DinJ toxin-antitoxin module
MSLLGMAPSSVIEMLYSQIVLQKGLPFLIRASIKVTTFY